VRDQAVESYYEFGGNRIVLSQEEVDKVKSMDIPQGITTIGFAPKKLVIKPGYNLRPSWLMRPDDKKAINSSTTMRSFLQVLEEKDFVAICCIRKRSGEVARLHALVPQSEVRKDRKLIAPEGFHVVPLPYADDVRSLPGGFGLAQEGERGGAPSRDAIDVAKQLVKSVNLGKNFTSSLESGDLRNPSLLRQFAHIEACALATAVNEDDAVTNVAGARLRMEPPDNFCTGSKADEVSGLVESLKQAISSTYDEDLEMKGTGKRKAADPEAAAKKAAKKEESEKKAAETDWQGMRAAGKLNKATVVDLTAYCKAHGLTVPSKAKKQDLLELVEKHLSDA
jgi:ATP-dependent DNA helicase 2 subunit 1